MQLREAHRRASTDTTKLKLQARALTRVLEQSIIAPAQRSARGGRGAVLWTARFARFGGRGELRTVVSGSSWGLHGCMHAVTSASM